MRGVREPSASVPLRGLKEKTPAKNGGASQHSVESSIEKETEGSRRGAERAPCSVVTCSIIMIPRGGGYIDTDDGRNFNLQVARRRSHWRTHKPATLSRSLRRRQKHEYTSLSLGR